MNGRYVPSLLAAIAEVIERHMIDIGFLVPEEATDTSPEFRKAAVAMVPQGVGATCPRCGHPSLIHREGCLACLNCAYSKCG